MRPAALPPGRRLTPLAGSPNGQSRCRPNGKYVRARHHGRAARLSVSVPCATGTQAVSDAEGEANRRRWEESGGAKEGTQDEWRWTLNWDEVTEDIVVGSCPRSRDDLDRMIDEAGVSAVLSVQSDLCLEALKIDWEDIRQHGVARGVLMARVPTRDFDHGDQSLMLPEAVRTLAVLLAFGGKVYVHCTAGINRASLTVLGYLTFVQGMHLTPALKLVKSKRPQANPYMDCWKAAKARMLAGRESEVVEVAKALHQAHEKDSKQKDAFGNWMAAESKLIQDTFRRHIANSLSLIASVTDLKVESVCSICVSQGEVEKIQQEVTNLRGALEEERGKLVAAVQELRDVQQHADRDGAVQATATVAGDTVQKQLMVAEKEIARLRSMLGEVASISASALSVPPWKPDGHLEDGAQSP
ncbi:unnamed protein product [Ostreobium quekettii]|uniref:Tyrosine specific protein phosphatases domain-containing protein n=1 Tax=Ostreobium quekettii TaxID=121088 RepID=A0A8S1J2X4_9CHLO|nr:unnamed protein product [Ostreobium quekettii]